MAMKPPPRVSEMTDEQIEEEAARAPNRLNGDAIRDALRACRDTSRINERQAAILKVAMATRQLPGGERRFQAALARARDSEQAYIAVFAAAAQAYAAAGLGQQMSRLTASIDASTERLIAANEASTRVANRLAWGTFILGVVGAALTAVIARATWFQVYGR